MEDAKVREALNKGTPESHPEIFAERDKKVGSLSGDEIQYLIERVLDDKPQPGEREIEYLCRISVAETLLPHFLPHPTQRSTVPSLTDDRLTQLAEILTKRIATYDLKLPEEGDKIAYACTCLARLGAFYQDENKRLQVAELILPALDNIHSSVLGAARIGIQALALTLPETTWAPFSNAIARGRWNTRISGAVYRYLIDMATHAKNPAVRTHHIALAIGGLGTPPAHTRADERTVSKAAIDYLSEILKLAGPDAVRIIKTDVVPNIDRLQTIHPYILALDVLCQVVPFLPAEERFAQMQRIHERLASVTLSYNPNLQAHFLQAVAALPEPSRVAWLAAVAQKLPLDYQQSEAAVRVIRVVLPTFSQAECDPILALLRAQHQASLTRNTFPFAHYDIEAIIKMKSEWLARWGQVTA